MRCGSSSVHLTPTVAGLITSLLLAIFAVPLGAQSAPQSRPEHGFGVAYDAAREITLTGTIQEVVTKHVPGSPVGMHLLVSGADGVTDVHVGPYLTTETKEALHTGTPVQIVGATIEVHDKQYLLARELGVGGRTIIIRSKRGALLYAHGDHLNATHITGTKTTVKAEDNGGAR